MIDPVNFAIGVTWGIFTFGCWTITMRGRWSSWRRNRDRRARRELLFITPLWAISLLWGLVLFFSVIRDLADVGTAVRGLLFGVGVGLYTFAGMMGAIGTKRGERRD